HQLNGDDGHDQDEGGTAIDAARKEAFKNHEGRLAMTAVIGKSAQAPSALPGRLRRVLAPNPSPMTGPGTWTDIIGSGEVAVIDPGPDLELHLQAILAALEPGEKVSAILVTHA